MWKPLILVECTVLMATELPQGPPLKPEEVWKSLDNPRNRDLVNKTLEQSVIPVFLNIVCSRWIGITTTKFSFLKAQWFGVFENSRTSGIRLVDKHWNHKCHIVFRNFYGTYFSEREFTLGKFPNTFPVNNDKSNPVSFYMEPVASAFTDNEEKKNPFGNYLRS
ncbi:uncharacterized protein C2orf66 homolog [Thamnophis elegans]|uniref:uncharacterized protein C2orf66 homolog n=1 Tax=Thamnophis elegans TaxID=35005 RepID=UPI0013789C12|nr:uncharacterized protein C2orf66 homolog [Thamnophis elegans]